jgi:hypothetical protein
MNLINKPKSSGSEDRAEAVDTQAEKSNPDISRRDILRLLFLGVAGIVSGLPGKAGAEWRDPVTFEEEPTWIKAQMDRIFSSAELMNPVEVQRMQDAQEVIFRTYLNPALTMYMSYNTGKQKTADEMMEIAMRHPFDLKYAGRDNGVIEITKKPGCTISNKELPDNFKIKVDGSGHLVEINGMEIPVFSQDEYDRLGRESDIPQFANALDGQKRKFAKQAVSLGLTKTPETVKLVSKKALKNLTPKIKQLFESRNMVLPRRLRKCIEIRNLAYKLDNTENNDAYNNFTEALKTHAIDFNDMVSDYPEKLKIRLEFDPEYPGVYIFRGRGSQADKTAVADTIPFAIAFTREGYPIDMMSKTIYRIVSDAQGNKFRQSKTILVPKSQRNSEYDGKIKRLYEEKFPQAKESENK